VSSCQETFFLKLSLEVYAVMGKNPDAKHRILEGKYFLHFTSPTFDSENEFNKVVT